MQFNFHTIHTVFEKLKTNNWPVETIPMQCSLRKSMNVTEKSRSYLLKVSLNKYNTLKGDMAEKYPHKLHMSKK